MAVPDDKAYRDGQLSARRAIANCVPRIVTDGADGLIDLGTGLPFARMSGPMARDATTEAFIRGFNDETLRAVASEEITRDFRPLLMTREQIEEAFSDALLGTLSLECRRLDDPYGRFALRLHIPKPPKIIHSWTPKSRPVEIRIDRSSGDRNRYPLHFGEPVDVALGRDGLVLLLKTDSLYQAFDVETTQILNLYRIK